MTSVLSSGIALVCIVMEKASGALRMCWVASPCWPLNHLFLLCDRRIESDSRRSLGSSVTWPHRIVFYKSSSLQHTRGLQSLAPSDFGKHLLVLLLTWHLSLFLCCHLGFLKDPASRNVPFSTNCPFSPFWEKRNPSVCFLLL